MVLVSWMLDLGYPGLGGRISGIRGLVRFFRGWFRRDRDGLLFLIPLYSDWIGVAPSRSKSLLVMG